MIGDLAEAQDCVQEAFARAWLRWDSLTDGRGDPVGWVKTTAYRLAISHWRHWKAGVKALRKPMPQYAGQAEKLLARQEPEVRRQAAASRSRCAGASPEHGPNA